MISPAPLHIAKIKEFTVKPKNANGIPRRGAPRLVNNNVIPPIRPLFSTIVWSAKYAKHEGMPKPKEAPKRIERIVTCVTVGL